MSLSAPHPLRTLALTLAVVILVGCGETARLQREAGYGPTPTLPEPHKTLLPTINVAPAIGWPEGGKPIAAPGTQVQAFARGLDHPRWLYVLPNGDVLVAESNAPGRDDFPGIKNWIAGLLMKKAGAGVPSADRITLLRDGDGDGVAETRMVFAEHLHSPFGMALVGEDFYVANADALVRFTYRPGATHLEGPP